MCQGEAILPDGFLEEGLAATAHGPDRSGRGSCAAQRTGQIVLEEGRARHSARARSSSLQFVDFTDETYSPVLRMMDEL